MLPRYETRSGEAGGNVQEPVRPITGVQSRAAFWYDHCRGIGSLKKEIIFTGNVLNTSARIQGLCNQFDAELLVSEDMAKLLQLPATYTIKSVGDNRLKGRSKPMELFAISTSTLSSKSRKLSSL